MCIFETETETETRKMVETETESLADIWFLYKSPDGKYFHSLQEMIEW